jgi:hypothetical protein
MLKKNDLQRSIQSNFTRKSQMYLVTDLVHILKKTQQDIYILC